MLIYFSVPSHWTILRLVIVLLCEKKTLHNYKPYITKILAIEILCLKISSPYQYLYLYLLCREIVPMQSWKPRSWIKFDITNWGLSRYPGLDASGTKWINIYILSCYIPRCLSLTWARWRRQKYISQAQISHRTYIALVVVQLIGDVHKSQTGLSMFNYNISALV